MGLPIVTALFGLGTGLGVIALFTHVVDTPELLLRARRDDRPRRRDRLRAVHPHPLPRGVRHARAHVRATRASRSCRRWTPPGAPCCSPACTVVIALLGMMLLGVELPLRRRDLGVDRRAARDARLADLAARAADVRGPAPGAPAGRARPAPPCEASRGVARPDRTAASLPSANGRHGIAGGVRGRRRGGAWLRWSAFVAAPPVDDRDRLGAGDAA